MSWSKPPRELRKAKLDNLAVVPGSLLPFKGEWQEVANELPQGTTLIILPCFDGSARRTLEKVSSSMKARGRQVKILTQEQLSR